MRASFRRNRPSSSPIETVPLTLELPSGYFAAIHEAALVDFASMTLEVTGPTALKADLVPWSTGVGVPPALKAA